MCVFSSILKYMRRTNNRSAKEAAVPLFIYSIKVTFKVTVLKKCFVSLCRSGCGFVVGW